MTVRELMSRDPYAASVTTNIRHVFRILSESDVQHVPIVDNDSLVGIVSARELRSVISPALDSVQRPNDLERILSQPITSVMNTDVHFVKSEDELGAAIDVMVEHQLLAVPVVEAGSLKLIGMVNYVDALRAARNRSAPAYSSDRMDRP